MIRNKVTKQSLSRLAFFFSALIASVLVFSCGPTRGEFGFKTFRDDTYRKWADPLEFDSRDEISWVYQYPENVSPLRIGVVYMKKELVWVEAESSMQAVSPEARQVYGTVKKFPDGEYKIMLVDIDNGNRLVDERVFTVFTDEEEIDYPPQN